MKAMRLSSNLSEDQIIKKSKELGFVPVSSGLARSHEQLQLAYLLAKRSFNNKTNLAKIFDLEFLLWLCGEKDIRKALAKNPFKSDNFLLLSFKKPNKAALLRELEARELKLDLEKQAAPLELERISLSRT